MKLQRRKIQEAATARTVEQEQWEQQWCFESRAKCWAGQKVCAGFSVRCYGKTQINFLANSTLQCFNESFPLPQSGYSNKKSLKKGENIS